MDEGSGAEAGDAQRSAAAEFSDLFRLMLPEVRSWLAFRVGREAAEDAAAETFMAVWARWQSVPAEHSIRRAYVYGVAANIIRRIGARRAKEISIRERLAGVPQPRDPDPAEAVAGGDRVRRELAVLSRAEREVFELVVWADLEPRDVAAILGCSANAVAARLSRARRRLSVIAVLSGETVSAAGGEGDAASEGRR